MNKPPQNGLLLLLLTFLSKLRSYNRSTLSFAVRAFSSCCYLGKLASAVGYDCSTTHYVTFVGVSKQLGPMPYFDSRFTSQDGVIVDLRNQDIEVHYCNIMDSKRENDTYSCKF